MNKSLVILIVLVALVLVAPNLAPYPAEASGGQCPAPGGGYAGALNMVHDATMLTIPMVRDAPQGNAGMVTAVEKTACP